MKKIHILAPDIGGGAKNFCIAFGNRFEAVFDFELHFYNIDFSESKLSGLKIGGRTRTQDQAEHVWKTIDLQPTDILVCNDGRELLWVGASGIPNPVVYVMHGDNKSYYDAISLNGHLCDLIVCINPGILEKLKATVTQEKLFYLPQIFTPSDKSIEQLITIKTNNSRPRIAFIGRATEAKGFDTLLTAIEQNPCFDFEVVIGGEPPAGGELSQFSNVTLHLNIPHGEVFDILEKSDLLFFPSRKEGLPLSILEALSCGCSVLCLNLLGFSDAFRELSNISFATDSDSLLRCLKKAQFQTQTLVNVQESKQWGQASSDIESCLVDHIDNMRISQRNRQLYSWKDQLPRVFNLITMIKRPR